MNTHVTPAELEQYVIGALDAQAAASLEAHCESCETCAALLTKEAQLELSLEAVAKAPIPLRARRRLPVGLTVGFAAAAALILVVVTRADPPPPSTGAPKVERCTDPGSATTCIARAKFDGVITIGPDQRIEVPRYDTKGTP